MKVYSNALQLLTAPCIDIKWAFGIRKTMKGPLSYDYTDSKELGALFPLKRFKAVFNSNGELVFIRTFLLRVFCRSTGSKSLSKTGSKSNTTMRCAVYQVFGDIAKTVSLSNNAILGRNCWHQLLCRNAAFVVFKKIASEMIMENV